MKSDGKNPNFPNLPVKRLGSIILESDKCWDLKVRGKKEVDVRALVDSGADTSVIHPLMVEKLGARKIKCGPFGVTLSVADAGPGAIIYDYVDLEITCPVFGTCMWKFFVLDECTSEMVIGKDFMTHFHGVLDFAEESIKFKRAPSAQGVKKKILLRSCRATRKYFSKPEDSDSSEDE